MVSKEACADLKTGFKCYVIDRGDLRALCLHGRKLFLVQRGKTLLCCAATWAVQLPASQFVQFRNLELEHV